MTHNGAIERHDVVIVGAGFAGLGCAAALRARGIDDVVLLERGSDVGHFWSTTYDRLRLHSPWHGIAHDGDLGRGYPMFKPRDHVVEFCRAYARRHGLQPHLRFGAHVDRLERGQAAGNGGYEWRAETQDCTYLGRFVAVATAVNRRPIDPVFAQQASFRGRVLHSASYRNAAAFVGERVLVVGSGNSAAEIALDLVEHGAGAVAMWVRGPRHFISLRVMARLFRIFRLLGQFSPARLDAAHRIAYGSAAFWQAVRQRDAVVGRFSADLSRFGIGRPANGPQTETFRHGRIPVFDVGAIPAIRAGRIRVLDGNARPIVGFVPEGVRLGDRVEPFDSVILATGFEPGLEEFLANTEMLGPQRWLRSAPLTDGRSRSRVHPSAFFPGFEVSVSGGLSLGRWGWEAGERIADALGAGTAINTR